MGGGVAIQRRPDRPQSDVEVTHQLIESCQGLVRSVAWKIHRKLPRNIELDDLIAYGQVGLAEAALRFDPDQKIQFITYAYRRIRGAILDGLSQMSWFKLSDYDSSRYEYMNEDSSESSDGQSSDDAAELGAKEPAEVERSRASSERGNLSTPSMIASDRELRLRIRQLIEELPLEEGLLIHATYFEGVSLTEAGNRLQISKSWATRMHTRALQRLARGLRLLGAAD